MAKESDIISIAVGETWRHAGMVAKASGSAITTGIVSYYLKAKTGTNAGKWWKDSDQTWAVAETANAMSHDIDGNWTIELSSSPFLDGVVYLEAAMESGNLHVAGEGRLLRGVGYAGGDYTQTVTVKTSGAVAIQNASVYVIDVDGNIIDKQTTNASGVATPSADAGTYTLKVTKGGYATSSTSITVTAAAARAVTLTALSVTPPANPDDCACAWVCLDDADNPVAGVNVRARPDTDATGTGYAWSGHTRTATSVAGTGLATINLPQGSKWWIRSGSGEEELFTVPATTTSTTVVSVRGGKRDTY